MSVRLLVPELELAAGPHGALTDYLTFCQCGELWVGGRSVPYAFYISPCTLAIDSDYATLPWDTIDSPEPWCPPKFPVPESCYNPCSVDCLPPRLDMTRWRELIPTHWEYPEVAASATVEIDAGEGASLWWY